VDPGLTLKAGRGRPIQEEMRLLLPVILFGLLASSAAAYPRLPEPLPPVAHNPADALAEEPIELSIYDRATRCRKRTKPGVVAMTAWLQSRVRGVFWGSYRCEKWGRDSASLHAENRKHVDTTSAHRDHIHIGMSKAGARGLTSFWAD
jgi:hypothetical protein